MNSVLLALLTDTDSQTHRRTDTYTQPVIRRSCMVDNAKTVKCYQKSHTHTHTRNLSRMFNSLHLHSSTTSQVLAVNAATHGHTQTGQKEETKIRHACTHTVLRNSL
eukprot:GDKI01041972.1.p2 GENE.GDKI01041972.1~~GDKI01041972.1.p2  ORF type:complete len:122 (+),score=32.86 GDKI01041972.1:48-368(+)